MIFILFLIFALGFYHQGQFIALLHVGVAILASMQLVKVGLVCVRISMAEKGFEHGLQDIVCVYFNLSK